MSQEDINRDLGSYIKERKDKPFWKKYDVKKIHPKHSDEEMDVAIREELKHDFEDAGKKEEEHISPHNKKELEEMEEEIIEVNEAEKYVEEEQENVLNKFFKKLNFSDKKEEKKEHEHASMSNNPDIEMSDEELRELLHGLHNWIIQLPSDKLEKFKNSKEFELYTKYLRKHNLIK
jgi:hypothetical protein